jgi:hypothetical protein
MKPALILGLLGLVALPIPLPVQAAADGERWEITSSMSMAGFSMPASTRSVCTARGGDGAAPMGDDGRCTMKDVQRSGNTMRWKAVCKEGSGTGEITYQGRESYTGTMVITTDGQTATMKLAGKRLPGSCDPAEAGRAAQAQLAAIRGQNEQATAQLCGGAVRDMHPDTLQVGNMCDAHYKSDFCKNLGTPDGFAMLAARSHGAPAGVGTELDKAGTMCAVAIPALRTRLCTQADKQESLDFLASACLGDGKYGQRIAARECAGRGYTSPAAARYRDFCSAYVGRGLARAPADTAAPAPTSAGQEAQDKAREALDMGKKLLKGLFN